MKVYLILAKGTTMSFIYRAKQFILFSGDAISLMLGLWVSISLRFFSPSPFHEYTQVLTAFIFVFIVWIFINGINGLYDLEKMNNTFFFYRRITESSIISLLFGVIYFYALPTQNITPKTILLLTVICSYSFIALWRLLYNSYIGKNTLQINILFVGYSSEVQELIDITKANPGKGYVPVALIDPNKDIESKNLSDITVYRTLKTIRPAITNHKINLVVIAPDLKQNTEALRELYELLFWPVHITNLPTLYETVTGRIPPITFSEGWFLDHLKNKERAIYDHMRTCFDYAIAILLLPLFFVLFPFIALAIISTSPGPVFIKQLRVGKNGKEFFLYKFRSMYALSKDGSAEIQGAQFAQKNDERITSVGKILRKTRMDELPQLLNILKRDVALIGPRPERPEIVRQLEEKMPYYSLRHTIKPGLTGWAAVHQHYTDTLETSLQKLQYDLFYIKNRSFLLDLSIFLRTINVVVRMMGQ